VGGTFGSPGISAVNWSYSKRSKTTANLVIYSSPGLVTPIARRYMIMPQGPTLAQPPDGGAIAANDRIFLLCFIDFVSAAYRTTMMGRESCR
jgi:hypothetical protein